MVKEKVEKSEYGAKSIQVLEGLDPVASTNIWFFVLGQECLHGIMPAQAQNIVVRSTILPDASSLVYHLTMPVGIALGSISALSVIKNATLPKCNGYRN